jgi:hypothetical protein
MVKGSLGTASIPSQSKPDRLQARPAGHHWRSVEDQLHWQQLHADPAFEIKSCAVPHSSSAANRNPSTAALGLERYIAAISIIAIAWQLIARYAFHAPAHLSEWPLIAALVIGGVPLTITLRRWVAQGQLALIFSPAFRS